MQNIVDNLLQISYSLMWAAVLSAGPKRLALIPDLSDGHRERHTTRERGPQSRRESNRKFRLGRVSEVRRLGKAAGAVGLLRRPPPESLLIPQRLSLQREIFHATCIGRGESGRVTFCLRTAAGHLSKN